MANSDRDSRGQTARARNAVETLIIVFFNYMTILVQAYTCLCGEYPSKIYSLNGKSTHIWHLVDVNSAPLRAIIFFYSLFYGP